MDVNNNNLKQQFEANCLFLYKENLFRATSVFINTLDTSVVFEDYEGYPIQINEADKTELKSLAVDTRLEAERVFVLARGKLISFLREGVSDDEHSE